MASCCPMIYDNTVFLLKPPYLYLVINCIIVSIVATSKLTNKSSSNIDDSDFSEVATPLTVVPVPSDIDTGYLNVAHAVASDYTGYVDNGTLEDVQECPKVIADDKVTVGDVEDQQPEAEKPKPISDPSAVSTVKLSRKPPRFGQQLRNSPEGGGGNKKLASGVSKPPRRQDTLETTWKKITEERSMPLTKHLRKSDTLQERSQVQSSKEKMTKSDNLNDINAPSKEEETLRKTQLKREPSPGQEELNRRVEAFIKKFNEEMRLQRLESLAKYNEMVNGGTPF